MTHCIVPPDGHRDKDGYVIRKHQGKVWRLHRLIYTLCYGAIPDKMVVGHRCNNKGCVNPIHLYITTAKENSTDAARDGLYLTGDKNPKYNHALACARETREDIIDLYKNYGMTQAEIGKTYGIHQVRVSEIIRGINIDER